MKQSLHIVVSLVAVVLLVRPLDCFAAAASNRDTHKTMECCVKGQCTPSAKADDCCKNTVPDGNQLVTAKAANHDLQAVVITASVSVTVPQSLAHPALPLRHPPPNAPLSANTLPLLI